MNLNPISGLSGVADGAATSYGIKSAKSSANVNADSHEVGSQVSATSFQSSSIKSQTVSATNKFSSFSTDRSSEDNKLAVLVMMLIELLLGLNQDDNKDKKNPLADLVTLLASSQRHSGGRTSFTQFQSSQMSQSVSVESTSAVQSVAYTSASGGANNGSSPLGGQLDISG